MKSSLVGILFMLLLFNGAVYCQDFWEQTSGPEGGWVRCIIVDKQNNIYAGFNGGEFGYTHLGNCIYRSQDAGLTWQSLIFPGNKDVESIVIDTVGTIFLWSGGSGAYKSTNHGITWISVSNGLDVYQDGKLGTCSNSFIVLGNNNGVYVSSNSGTNWILTPITDPVRYLYVDSNDNIFAGINYGGLYESSDYGLSWSQADYGLNGEITAMMQFDDSIYFAGTNQGIYESSDNCSTWNLLNGSPGHITALSKGIDNEIFAATSNNGLYVSSNSGMDWSLKNNGLINTHITSLANFMGNSVIAGTFGDGLFMSNSQNLSWQSVNAGIKCVNITSLLRYKQFLFAGSEEGMLYKSPDLGDSWTRIDSTYTFMPVSAFLKTRTNNLFFASWDYPYESSYQEYDLIANTDKIEDDHEIKDSPTPRVFKSTDEGYSWNETAQIYVNSFADYYDQNSGTEYLLAAADYMGIRISTDDGNSWYPANNGIEGIIQDIETNSSGIFFASSPNAVFRSTDFGVSWQPVYTYSDVCYRIVMDVSENDYVYAGFDWGAAVLSTDNGDNWTGLNYPAYGVYSIITDSLNRVYLGNRWGQISQSFDYGQHWTDISSGMIGGLIMNLECDYEGNIFVGTNGGSVYRGVSNIFVPRQVILAFPPSGATNVSLTPELKWHPSDYADLYEILVSLNNSFDSAAIVFHYTTPDTSRIVDSLEINTRYYWKVRCSNQFGNSSWSQMRTFKTINPSSTEEDDQNKISFELAQNYPNPFNPETKIKWQTPDACLQTLKIYNVLGEEVATLVNEYRPAGRYEIRFNIGRLPSGVYLYKLTAGSYSTIKKMIILK